MEKLSIQITPVDKEESINSIVKQDITSFARLGKEVKISPKANCNINKAGYKLEFFTETVDIIVGIGNDHIATLIMTKEAWEALQTESVNIITTEQFKKKLYHG